MENKKRCPYCAGMVNVKAHVCKYCNNILGGDSVEKNGKLVRVRLKTRDKVYTGDIFMPYHITRISDVINDTRHFILLSNTSEETKTSEINIGFLAINKK
jgi:phosphotransferase system IIA component